jgi:hypothetical protein
MLESNGRELWGKLSLSDADSVSGRLAVNCVYCACGKTKAITNLAASKLTGTRWV